MEYKIDIYYYVIMKDDDEQIYFKGFYGESSWSDNIGDCYKTTTLSKAREMKEAVSMVYRMNCKIVKVKFLEVE